MNPLETLIGTEDMEIPVETVPFYVATSKGWLVSTPTLFGAARVISDEHPTSLPELKESFQLNDVKMPVHMLSQFHDFARQNWEKNKAECSAYLTFNDETGIWRLFIPEQYVSHTSVNHRLDVGAIRQGFRAVGTIHSHCDFGAFHSGTDTHDMGKMPGLHITIGHVDTSTPEFAFALSVSDAVFDIERTQIIDESITRDSNGYDTAHPSWLRFVNKGTAPWGYGGGVRTTYHKAQSKTKGKPYAKPLYNNATGTISGYNWDDDDYGWYGPNNLRQGHLWKEAESDEAFTDHALLVSASEEILEMEAIHLAMSGFNLGFTITHNPTRAQQFLRTQGIVQKDEVMPDDTALLPEEI